MATDAIVTRKGLTFKPDTKTFDSLKKKYTIVHEGFNFKKTREEFTYNGKNKYTFPRFAVHQLVKSGIIHPPITNFTDGDDIKIDSKLVSTTNQKLVFNNIIASKFTQERLDRGIGGTTIEMGTGRGKTYLGLRFVAHFNKKALIIAPRVAILDQWADVIREQFPGTSIGQLYNGKQIDGDIVLATIHTIIKTKYYKPKGQTEAIDFLGYLKSFGFMILDEIHMYCSDNFAQVFRIAQCKRTLGITATSNDRNDPYDKVAWWWYGKPQKAECMNGFDVSGTNFKTDIREIRYYGPPNYTRTVINRDGVPSSGGTINLIMKDPQRKKALVDIVKEYMDMPGRYIYLVFEHRSAVEEYSALLDAETPETKDNVNVLMGGVSKEESDLAKKKSKLIVCTYNYITTGISVVRMNTIILGSPRKSGFKQLIGRIRRLGSDEKIRRVVVDIVDSRTFLSKQWYDRKKIYDHFFESSYLAKIKLKDSDN